MITISAEQIEAWLRLCAKVFVEHKEELTELDAAIGDADHGANMARGFTAVQSKLDGLASKDIGTLFKTTAMTLISQVGGASGPLYGTLFLQASKPAEGKMEIELGDLCRCFDAGLAGVVNLGKAKLGDKTMVDALTPGFAALQPQDGDTLAVALERAASATEAASEATIPLVAKKGRASYLGERSSGHKDPGAASSALLLRTFAQAVGPQP